MENIIKLNNVFTFKYIDFDNTVVNYCIDSLVDNCTFLEKSHKYVKYAKNHSVGSIFKINNIIVRLIYKGLDIDKTVTKYSEKYRNKVIKEAYFEDEVIFSSSEITKCKNILVNNLKKFNELGFVHETAISNIRSIYSLKGIFSRDFINKNGINITDIADHNVLAITPDIFRNKARFYLRPATPAHYKFNIAKGSTCLFVCDYNIIFNRNSGVYMTDRIATDVLMLDSLNNYINISWLINNLRYDDIFNYNYVEGILKKYKGAEFLAENKVELKYLKAIIFSDLKQCYDFINEYPDWEIDVICDPDFF